MGRKFIRAQSGSRRVDVRLQKMRRAIRRRFPPPGTHLRVWIVFFLPWILLVAGASMAFVSYLPQVAQIDSLQFSGSVAANDTVALNFTASGYSHVAFAFEERPSCSLRAYALDTAAADLFVTSSVLPDPLTSLNCDRLQGVFSNLIALIVIDNPFAGPELNYSLRADLFLVSQPDAIWVVPGFALFLGGAVAVIARMLRSGLTQIVDDIAEEDPIPYWEQEKR